MYPPSYIPITFKCPGTKTITKIQKSTSEPYQQATAYYNNNPPSSHSVKDQIMDTSQSPILHYNTPNSPSSAQCDYEQILLTDTIYGTVIDSARVMLYKASIAFDNIVSMTFEEEQRMAISFDTKEDFLRAKSHALMTRAIATTIEECQTHSSMTMYLYNISPHRGERSVIEALLGLPSDSVCQFSKSSASNFRARPTALLTISHPLIQPRRNQFNQICH